MTTAPLLIWLLLSWMMAPWQGLAPTPGGLKGYSGGGSVSYDNATGNSCTVATCTTTTNIHDTLTISHTITSANSLAAYVCVSGSSGTVQPHVSSATWAGSQSLSQVLAGTGNYYCDIWALPAGTSPTTGTQNLVIVLANSIAGGSDIFMGVAISMAGVNGSQVYRTSSPTQNNGSGASASVTLGASVSGDLAVAAVCSGTTGTKTPGGSQTARATIAGNDSGACNTMQLTTAAGGTTSNTWTIPSDSWRVVGASFQP